MHRVKLLLDFYIQSSLHVGFAVFCLVKVTLLQHPTFFLDQYPLLVFFGTLTGYNFLKYYSVFKEQKVFSTKNKAIVFITLLAIRGFGIIWFSLNSFIEYKLVIASFFVIVYPKLRKYGWMKMFLVSFVVTYVTVYIPLNYSVCSSLEYYFSLIERFLIITALLIPFEIIDLKTDAISLNTLPQIYGISKIKRFGYLLVVISFLVHCMKENWISFYFSKPFCFTVQLIVTFIVDFIVVLAIYFSSIKRNKYYTSFWIESIPIIWMTLNYLLSECI